MDEHMQIAIEAKERGMSLHEYAEEKRRQSEATVVDGTNNNDRDLREEKGRIVSGKEGDEIEHIA